MDTLTKKTIQTTRGLTYTYYVKHPSLSSNTPPPPPKPTLFFVHGLPDIFSIWNHQIEYFVILNYPVIAINLLGYEGSSKPAELEAYNSKGIADDYADILDAEGIHKIIFIGHDVGAGQSYKMGLWHPERILGTVSLSIGDTKAGPPPPGGLETMIKGLATLFGYENFAYMRFLTAPDGPKVSAAHPESFFDVVYGKDEQLWKYQLSNADVLRKFIEEGRTQPVFEWAGGRFRDDALARFARDGFDGIFMAHRLYATDISWKNDKNLPESRLHLDYPGLYISGTKDSVSGTVFAERMKQVRKDLTIKWVDAGHWMMQDKPEEVNSLIEQWLEERV